MPQRPAPPTQLPQTITETLGYLTVQICKSHRNKAQELLGQLEPKLHVGQEMLLLQLWTADGISQSELAEEVCIQPATLTRSIDRLSQVGLVERRIDDTDQRVSRVYLTDAGRAMHESIERVWYELEALSFANLTAEERVLLRRLLLQVYANLQE
jgi:MarR family transcriptional regulator, organic hydroperoxide resistance regulator